ncbi:MAG: hypothetical protein LBR20_08815 [Propionibacteriaceae bacterium]|jgi:hypothetical protein|nr:hypothetical protein [Propionibacteriaceae bacterium]
MSENQPHVPRRAVEVHGSSISEIEAELFEKVQTEDTLVLRRAIWSTLPEEDDDLIDRGRRFADEDDEPPPPSRRAIIEDEPQTPEPEPAAEEPAPKPKHRVKADKHPKLPEPPQAEPKRRKSKVWLLILVGLIVVGLVAWGITWALQLGPSPAPTATPTASPSTSQEYQEPVLSVEDVTALGMGTWSPLSVEPPATSMLCIGPIFEEAPLPERLVAREMANGSTETAQNTIVNMVATYPDETEASRVYQLQLTALGNCPDPATKTPAGQILNTYQVDRLVDEAIVESVLVRNVEADVYHTILLGRTGRVVIAVDLSSSDAEIPPTKLADAVKNLFTRLCKNGQGSCPTGMEATKTVPPVASEPAGWLEPADLPRITAGQGTWSITKIDASASDLTGFVGSQCEVQGFTDTKDVNSAIWRQLILGADVYAPRAFGVDEIIYTMDTKASATKLANRFIKEITECADSVPTAKVTEGDPVEGSGDFGMQYSGQTFVVEQGKVSETIATYRVAVVAVDNKVIYLLGSKGTDTFSFTDKQWLSMAERAGQRATQG